MARWTKDQRDKAKAEGLWLVAIAVDGRPAKTFGAMDYAGPATEEEAREVVAFMERFMSRRHDRLGGGK